VTAKTGVVALRRVGVGLGGVGVVGLGGVGVVGLGGVGVGPGGGASRAGSRCSGVEAARGGVTLGGTVSLLLFSIVEADEVRAEPTSEPLRLLS